MTDLGQIGRRVERVGEKHRKKLCWLGEAKDKDVRRKNVRNTIKKGLNGIKLPSYESLNLRREKWKVRLKSQHAKYTLNGTRRNKKRLVVYSHSKSDFGIYRAHVRVEHLH